MYLENVLADIKKETVPPKLLNAEHLYKLNEAIFNLPEEDRVDTKQVSKLFAAVEKVRQAYNGSKIDNTDSNFFYDYVALLGTMQNQHFFTSKQTEKMLEWIKEAVDESSAGAAPSNAEKKAAATIKKLEEENAKLHSFERKYQELLAASKHSSEGAKGKGKGKKGAPKDDDDYDSDSVASGKAGGKKGGKGKGKSASAAHQQEPEGKSNKGKKGKGKGKGADRSESPSYEDERPAKGGGKSGGKGGGGSKGGKGSSKGGQSDSWEDVDDRPPIRDKGGGGGGGKGSSSKGGGKGKSGGKGSWGKK